jgi:hypothetical protein
MNAPRLSALQRQVLIRSANRLGVPAELRAIQALPASAKRDLKIWLGGLILSEGMDGDEISARGKEIDDFIDLVGY